MMCKMPSPPVKSRYCRYRLLGMTPRHPEGMLCCLGALPLHNWHVGMCVMLILASVHCQRCMCVRVHGCQCGSSKAARHSTSTNCNRTRLAAMLLLQAGFLHCTMCACVAACLLVAPACERSSGTAVCVSPLGVWTACN